MYFIRVYTEKRSVIALPLKLTIPPCRKCSILRVNYHSCNDPGLLVMFRYTGLLRFAAGAPRIFANRERKHNNLRDLHAHACKKTCRTPLLLCCTDRDVSPAVTHTSWSCGCDGSAGVTEQDRRAGLHVTGNWLSQNGGQAECVMPIQSSRSVEGLITAAAPGDTTSQTL
jgi:hypothetical protein